MVLFGIAIGVLIIFLGGLMAVDLVPRKASEELTAPYNAVYPASIYKDAASLTLPGQTSSNFTINKAT